MTDYLKSSNSDHFVTRNSTTSGVGSLFFIDHVRSLHSRKDLNFDPFSIEFVEAVRPREATNPRDKIYAVWGMARDRFTPDFEVVYEPSVEDVYINFATYCLVTRRSLRILSSVSPTPRKMPSWVPDWSICGSEHQPRVLRKSFVSWRQRFSAGGTYLPTVRLLKEHMLSIHGAKLSRILLNGPTSCGPTARESTADQARLARVLSTIWDLAKLGISDLYPSGGSRFEAFVTTLYSTGSSISNISKGFYEGKAEDPNTRLGVLFLMKNYLEAITRSEVQTGVDFTSLPPDIRDFDSWSSEDFRRQPGRFFAQDMLLATLRRFFVTENGYMGLAPPHAEVGDMICVFYGGPMLYILRETGKDSHKTLFHQLGGRKEGISDESYRLIGDCYVHGLMGGESAEWGVPGQQLRIV